MSVIPILTTCLILGIAPISALIRPTTENPFSLNSIQSFFESLNPSQLNSPCSVSSSKIQGVCMKSTACARAQGMDLGECPRLGWSCCVIPVTGSVKPSTPTVVTQPAVLLTSSNSSLGVFEFPKQSGMCSLAVNFLDSKFAQPSSGLEDSGNCVEEVVSITGSPTLIAGFLPVCGDMSGQIIHLSYGRGALATHPSDKITITIKTSGSKYAINVVQVGCDDPDLVASFCLQQFVAETGTVRSFGYPRQLNNLYYHICTRGVEEGARTVTWQECPGGSATPKFFITRSHNEDGSLPPPLSGDVLCASDYVSNILLNPPGRHCGGAFPKVTVDAPYGHLTVTFDEIEVGYTPIVRNLPPSAVSCDKIDLPGHACRHPTAGPNRNTTCLCTLDPMYLGRLHMVILPTENCPTIRRHRCRRIMLDIGGGEGNTCECIAQEYDEVDEKNTGFCLQFTHNY